MVYSNFKACLQFPMQGEPATCHHKKSDLKIFLKQKKNENMFASISKHKYFKE